MTNIIPTAISFLLCAICCTAGCGGAPAVADEAMAGKGDYLDKYGSGGLDKYGSGALDKYGSSCASSLSQCRSALQHSEVVIDRMNDAMWDYFNKYKALTETVTDLCSRWPTEPKPPACAPSTAD